MTLNLPRFVELVGKQHDTQASFAESIGVTKQSLNAYVKGHRRPGIVMLARLASGLGVSVADLIVEGQDIKMGNESINAGREAYITIMQACQEVCAKETEKYINADESDAGDLLNTLSVLREIVGEPVLPTLEGESLGEAKTTGDTKPEAPQAFSLENMNAGNTV